MSIKKTLKNHPMTKGIYTSLKKVKDERVFENKVRFTGAFKKHSENREKLCVILAGYKEFLYPAVFPRIKRALTPDMDVCVVTSGMYSDTIDRMCEENNWSYLSTKENNVALVQNVAIHLHPNAKYIFKLDEDVFVPEGYFTNLMRAYKHAQQGEYVPGVMAPLLNVNGYAHMRILDKLGLKEVYAQKFEAPKYMAGPGRQIENNPDVAKFMWGEGGFVPTIDEMNTRFSQEPLEERACPIRFSIGAILFERKLWEDMGLFSVNRNSSDMGRDEIQMCAFCVNSSRPLMVTENVVAGHLSFGTQNQTMKQYFQENKERFL